MKSKKTLMTTALLCVVSFSCVISAFAHSGRTDASGGHKDNQNKSGLGSYHYHCGGNPPHLHSGGVCPYKSGGTATVYPSTSSYYDTYDYTPTYTDRYDEGYDDGYDEGYSDGKEIGLGIGYETGCEETYTEAYDKGYDEGYDRGKDDGIDEVTPLDEFLMYYTPISAIAIICLCFKAFSRK